MRENFVADTKLTPTMRKFHRWGSVVAAIFLLIVAVTGVILQVQHLTGEHDEEEGGKRPPALLTTAMPSSAYAALVARTIEATRARSAGAPVASVTLRDKGDTVEGMVAIAGDPGREITVDARSGRVLSDEVREGESIILRIHSGEILGEPGVILGLLWGLGLLALVVTGSWIYLDMYRRRRKGTGKRGLFW